MVFLGRLEIKESRPSCLLKDDVGVGETLSMFWVSPHLWIGGGSRSTKPCFINSFAIAAYLAWHLETWNYLAPSVLGLQLKTRQR